MANTIATAYAQKFHSNFEHLVQQKGSRLRPYVRVESIAGNEGAYFDQIGASEAQALTTRHDDTPVLDVPHSRRRVVLSDYNWGDLIDKADRVKMLGDPTNPYLTAAVNGMGRKMDDVLIAAALGNAATGVAGGTSTALPASQKYAANDGTNLTKLNLETLIAVKQLFMASDVDPDEQLIFVVNAANIAALLSEDKLTSSDYASVKALVEGKIDTFMGFKFVRTERLLALSGATTVDPTTGAVGSGAGDADGSDRAFAFATSGLLLGLGMDVVTRVEERADKNFSTQVYAQMALGAVRMEEEKVVEVYCAG